MNLANKSFIILGDVHIGARNSSTILCEHQISFFENELFPYMEQHGIKDILQLGDMFDSRKFSNHIILHTWKTRVFDIMEKRGYRFVTLLGNHDIASRNTLLVNSSNLFLSTYKNIEIINEPTVITFNGVDILVVPWICLENEKQVNDSIKHTTAKYCAGHFEFAGFEMQKGIAAHGDMNISNFANFDIVFSGHYHTRNKKHNVLYCGVPYEMTWADYNDEKGFHVFDCSTHKIKFIKTNQILFNRIEYNDKDGNDVTIPPNLKNTYVKIVVLNKTDPYKFEKFIDNINFQAPADLKITDIEVDFDDMELDDNVLELEDTKILIDKFIKQLETGLDKNKITNMVQSLYLRSLETIE